MENLDSALAQFKHKIPVTIRYADLDTFKHVNNKAYLSFLEEARITYHRDVLGFDAATLDFRSVVAHISVDYLFPITYTDTVWLYTRCPRIGSKSFDMETLVVKESKKSLLLAAKAMVTMVSFDPITEIAIPNPKSEMDKVRVFECMV